MIDEHLFGIIIPGRPLITQFEVISPTKVSIFIPEPAQVTEIVFFLQRLDVLPYGHGIMIYVTHNDSDWELLGAVSADKPSGVFRTGWSTNEKIRASPIVKLGASIEPLDTISNLNLGKSGLEDRYSFALKIAQDLYQYMASFTNSTCNFSSLPGNIFDRWMQRFEIKYKQDPNFMMKSNL